LLARWRAVLLALAARRRLRLPYAAAAHMLGLLAGVLAAGATRAVELPEDRADLMYHYYDGAGTKASGPAVLVRKSLADRVSLSGGYYLDMVSNASIDVVTTASPYKENRSEETLGLDYVYRDASITLSGSNSSEPDYHREKRRHRRVAGGFQRPDDPQPRLHAGLGQGRQKGRGFLRHGETLARIASAPPRCSRRACS